MRLSSAPMYCNAQFNVFSECFARSSLRNHESATQSNKYLLIFLISLCSPSSVREENIAKTSLFDWLLLSLHDIIRMRWMLNAQLVLQLGFTSSEGKLCMRMRRRSFRCTICVRLCEWMFSMIRETTEGRWDGSKKFLHFSYTANENRNFGVNLDDDRKEIEEKEKKLKEDAPRITWERNRFSLKNSTCSTLTTSSPNIEPQSCSDKFPHEISA